MTEFQPKPQTPEQVDEGLRNAFKQAIKDGVIDATPYLKQMTETDISKVLIEGEYATIMGVKYKRVEAQKPTTLYDIIAEWCDDDNDPTCEELVNRISGWLPKEHDTNSDGWNKCVRMIRENLR